MLTSIVGNALSGAILGGKGMHPPHNKVRCEHASASSHALS